MDDNTAFAAHGLVLVENGFARLSEDGSEDYLIVDLRMVDRLVYCRGGLHLGGVAKFDPCPLSLARKIEAEWHAVREPFFGGGAPTTLEEYVAHVVRYVQIVPGLRSALLDALMGAA